MLDQQLKLFPFSFRISMALGLGSSNPWHVGSLNDFYYLCCPECDYQTKVETSFEKHAVQKHPMSNDFFIADTVKSEHNVDMVDFLTIKYEEDDTY